MHNNVPPLVTGLSSLINNKTNATHQGFINPQPHPLIFWECLM